MSSLPRRSLDSFRLHRLRAISFRAISLRLLGVLVVGGSSLVLSGCPGELDPALLTGTGGTGGPMVCDGAALMVAKCTQAGCHGSNGPQAGLDLLTAGVAARLVGKPSNATLNPICASNTKPYLDTGSNPATGFLLDKLMATPPCGSVMPEIPGPLGQADLNCMNEWAAAVTTGQIH
jgi:hypothetical protein